MAEYLEDKNVFDAALDRIRYCFDNFDEVLINLSGGKDSTVVMELALIVAKEKNKLPLKVMWLDQECEWQGTVDYVDEVMRRQDIKPYWWQIPFDFTNSLSNKNNFVRVWDEKAKDKWVHPQSDISIKENPTKENRFHILIEKLHYFMIEPETKHAITLIGMRADECLNRRKFLTFSSSPKEQPWIAKNEKKIKEAYPIFDWSFDDVWTAIAKNHWKYNRVYDFF